jgi:hypothetical protein
MTSFSSTILCIVLFSATMFTSAWAERHVDAVRSTTPIKIDGDLSEPVWQRPGAGGFRQFDPQPGNDATERTEIWVAYNDDALYIAARLYDSDPSLIARNYGRRDASIESDWFWVGLDPYHDGRSGYFFVVNPVGTIRDGVLFDDIENDESWDGIWSHAERIDESGWSLEIRIPYSQLRFDAKPEQTWGINFRRTVKRKGEEDHFELMPREEGGYVSRFATLTGLNGIKPPARLEVIPYAVGGARFLQHEENDPFISGHDLFGDIGTDLKLGIGSSMTLDATVNPDFGQVEVDPAVVNLSAFETFFQEKRPFFLEGSSIFSFGRGNGGFGWFNPTFFYSRRVGRPPQGRPEHAGFADLPDRTTIIGAAKLTGKIADGWSLGLLSAATAREFAEVDSAGIRFHDEVEPFTAYNVLRSSREFNKGLQGLGLLATGVVRDIRGGDLERRLNTSAFTLGVDGWSYLDDDAAWLVSGWGGASHVAGSRERITSLQRSSQRYFQQPDATHLGVDTTATSLDGWSGRLQLRKRSGNLRLDVALGAISPGFESNDIGFSGRADYLNGHISGENNWFESDGIFRTKNINAHIYQSYDFGGTILNAAYGLGVEAQLENFWGFDASLDYTPLTADTRNTRGGPKMDGPAGWFGNFSGYTDGRKEIQLSVYGGGSTSPEDIWGYYSGATLRWRPADQLQISIGPNWNRDFSRGQYIGTFRDSLATETYGARYIFANLDQRTLSADIRIDWSFTPKLSLQIYAQPFFAVGRFSSYKELSRPNSFAFNEFGMNGSTITRSDGLFTADPDGEGPAPQLEFYEPDFNVKSLRGTAVLRWEYLPGSTMYLVWTHTRANYDDPGIFRPGDDLSSLLGSVGDNILLLKVAYWIDM